MNKLFLSMILVLASSLMYSVAFSNVLYFADQAPMILMTETANKDDTINVINRMNNALVYSIVATQIRNGSGNKYILRTPEEMKIEKFPEAKKTENIVEKGLRQISIVDLYFQRSLQDIKIQNMKLGLNLFPSSGPLSNVLTSATGPFSNQTLKDIFGAFTPSAESFLKLEKSEKLDSRPVNQLIRDSQLNSLSKKYPADKTYNKSNSGLGKLAWLVHSHLPVSISSDFEVINSHPKSLTTFILPAIGIAELEKKNDKKSGIEDIQIKPLWFTASGRSGTQKMETIYSNVAEVNEIRFFPDSDNRKFDESTESQRQIFEERLKARALKVGFIKDHDQKHLLEMSLSFGYLPRFVSQSFNEMNVDLLKPYEATERESREIKDSKKKSEFLKSNQQNWVDLTKNIDFGLIAKGDVKLNKRMIPDDKRRDYINDLLSMFEIRIIFHKMHFMLNRLPVKQYENDLNTYLNNHPNDLNAFLKEDVGFKLENTKLNTEKSVITFRLSVKQDRINEYEKLSYFSDPVKKRLFSFLCQSLRSFEKNEGYIKMGGRMLFAPFLGTGSDEKSTIGDGVRYSTCEANFSSYQEFKKQFLYNLVNKFIMKEVNVAIKDSVEGQMSDSQAELDQTLDQISKKVLEAFEISIGTIQSQIKEFIK